MLKFSSCCKRRRDVAQTARYIQTRYPVIMSGTAKVNVIRFRLAMIFSHRCGFSQTQRYINRGVMGGGVPLFSIQLHSWGLFVIVSDI